MHETAETSLESPVLKNNCWEYLSPACRTFAAVFAVSYLIDWQPPAIAQSSASDETTKAAANNPAWPPPPAMPEDPTAIEAMRRKRFAITDICKVDADFHDQGEYFGTILLEGYWRQIGLQVVALGEGKFDALLYRGGLPGNGFDGSARMKLSGSRTGNQVTLTGEGLIVLLQSGYTASVKNAAGQQLGFLQPVKRTSPTMGAAPPANAIILFDGKSTDRLKDAKVTPDGLLEVGFETKDVFQNFTLHGEFRIPYMPLARGQDRGNSGFYLQRRYEVQVLDSFGLEPQFNDAGSLYRFKKPDQNMCFPPLQWQTYDITFQAAKFAPDGTKLSKARVTVVQNGVVIQNQVELEKKTGGGKIEAPEAMPILFQNHRNPVYYRNLWLVDHDKPNYVQPVSATTPCQFNCRKRWFRR